MARVPSVEAPKPPKAPVEEFGQSSGGLAVSGMEGPNLDVIWTSGDHLHGGRHTDISIRNLLQLNQGSVIELDRLAGEPLDVLVNVR